MAITIEDVAKATKVSLSTVSRVLNNTDHPISEQTRQRVLKIARKLGYRPNLHAKNLATQSNNTIEVFLDLTYDSAGETGFGSSLNHFLIAADQVAVKEGFHVILDITHSRQRNGYNMDMGCIPIAGAMIMSPRQEDTHVEMLANSKIPFLVVGSSEYNNYSYVDTDNITGASLALEHLIRLGHTRIACLGGPANFKPSIDRITGYRRALRNHNLIEREEWLETGDWTLSNGYTKMLIILENTRSDPPTAVYASNDMLALGAMRAIKSKNIRIPEDIAIVGFDDIPGTESTNPPLTTIRQPFRETGQLATEILIRMIKTGYPPKAPYHVLVPPKLVIRRSCGSVVGNTESFEQAL
ncbi:MAG: LacI family DNA-binding transcriptional regulator [bacterium]|nr:LacI family DNA-binding transcriptional regulator [Candidatus Sumerlaeota bacterium]